MEFWKGTVEGMVTSKDFWKDKKVLISGHTGFKGSWLSLWLQKMGSVVTGYSLPAPTIPNMFETAKVSSGMTSHSGDIRDLDHLTRVMSECQPEIIIHMAAQSLVLFSYENPVDTYATNVMGTVNILEAARRVRSAKVIIVVTSDKCYQNKEWFWSYREYDPMGGHDPYSSSKGCAELITSAYRNSYFPEKSYDDHGVAIGSVRAGNVIGGGDWSKDRLIPDIMRALMQKRPVIIRNPDSVRPWQYVLEPLNGYLCLAERLWENGPEFSGAWNFGPKDDDSKPVAWIVEALTKQWGDDSTWELDILTHQHESHQLKLDSSKARTLLDWSTRIPLSKTLMLIVDWYQAYQQKEDMRKITENEIECFEKASHAGNGL